MFEHSSVQFAISIKENAMLLLSIIILLHEIKIILGAVGTFVVELVHSHVLLLDFYCAIVEWVGGMLASGNGDNHIWS